MREFKGRVVTPGTAKAEAVVTHNGFNTLASLQKSLQFGDKTAKCTDQNNPDLYGKPLAGYALCLPQTIGSTTGGMVLYCACAMKRQPACMLFANQIKMEIWSLPKMSFLILFTWTALMMDNRIICSVYVNLLRPVLL